jgi:EAL domain-containing protein (putative c-di-GMP-specific phosphodiesterase class I)
VAIDDFGTGYSSLDLLARLPFDFVKIDRSLISGLDRNQRKMRLLQGLCGMIGALDTQPIAEGLERSEEAGLLRDLGCTIGQGYLFGRPQPAADVVARLGTRP